MKPARMTFRSLRQSRDIVDYLDVRMGGHDGNYPELQWHCPFCLDRRGDESSKRKLRGNVAKGKFICFRCGFAAQSFQRFFEALNGGDLRVLEIALLRAQPTAVPMSSLYATAVATLYQDDPGEQPLMDTPLPPEYRPLSETDPLCRRGYKYLLRRGGSMRLVEKYHIGYCCGGRYASRLVFPVIQHGRQVYFTTRACDLPNLTPDPLKSLNPPNVDGHYRRDDCLLNFDGVLGSKTVVVTEGPFSMMALDNAVATMGMHVTPGQVELLCTLRHYGTEEIVLGLDAEVDMGPLRARLLDAFPKVTVLPLESGDPWDNRLAIAELLSRRREWELVDRVSQRIYGEKNIVKSGKLRLTR